MAGSVAATAAEPEPADQLQRMDRALRELDYQGSFLYQSGTRLETLRLFHAAGEVERERVLSLSGARNEVVRVGDVITVFRPEASALQYSVGAAGRLLPLIPEALHAFPAGLYSLRSAGAERVAGYDADIVEILPADRYRYGYRVWLERGTRLPLRVVLVGSDQRAIEQMMFVTLSIGEEPAPADLALASSPSSVAAAVVEAPIAGEPRWVVDGLPAGFVMTSRRGTGDNSTAGAEHLVFSDGLATVSVYMEKAGDRVDDDVAMTRGAMNVYVRRIAGWRFTVLGNVPPATTQQFATGVRAATARTASPE